MNIGIFGGTFNPIHNGHLMVAEYIRSQFNLDKIYFIPSHTPPHKSNCVTRADHRMNMIELAINSNLYFHTSSIEIDRGGKSYSVDTLRYLSNEFIGKNNFFFIVGLDAFLEIHTWKEYNKLFDLCTFIVVNRHCDTPVQSEVEFGKTLSKIKHNLRFQFIVSNQNDSVHRIYSKNDIDLYFVQLPLVDISSTKIRLMIQTKFSVRYQLPDLVTRYIQDNNLYGYLKH